MRNKAGKVSQNTANAWGFWANLAVMKPTMIRARTFKDAQGKGKMQTASDVFIA